MSLLAKLFAPSEPIEPYNLYIHQLFDLIDDIEHSEILDRILTIPNVVAAGDQTSGKSSVLGRLSGIPLPTGDGTVTLCATQLQSRKSRDKSVCRMLAPEVKDIEVDDICVEVNNTQKKLVAQTSGSFNLDIMARIRVETPHGQNLTIVDLPGIIHSANSRTQDESVVEKVRETVTSYIENPKSIILCVVDMTRDLALNKIFDLVNKADPNGDRTIVVFTKIDKCVTDKARLEKLLDQIRNQDYHSYKHCVFVNSASTDEDDEFKFFQTISKDFGISFDQCSFKNLYSKVCYMLLTPILQEFSTSWGKVEHYRSSVAEEINKLPPPETNTVEAADRKLKAFIEASREMLKGSFSVNSSSQSVFSKQRLCFDMFRDEYLAKMDALTDSQNINEIVADWRKNELINFHNFNNFKSYAMPIITSFLGPAMKCHDAIRNLNKGLVMQMVLENFDGQPHHAEFLLVRVNRIFEAQQQNLNEQLEKMHKVEQYFYTDDIIYTKLLDRFKLDENFDRMKKSWDLIKVPLMRAPGIGEAIRIGDAAVGVAEAISSTARHSSAPTTAQSVASHNSSSCSQSQNQRSHELDYAELLTKFDSMMSERQGVTKHEERKKVTYETALEILKEIAMDRISTVVPATILFYMNDEVQREIQCIDRESVEFCELEWSTSEAELRRKQFEQTEAQIAKWQLEYLKIEKQIRRAVKLN